ncbi:alpha-galactosidase [Arthrobacter sp. AK01]|uniref:alpha-galactosidase n=1 Tax=Arthrobacter sp. AK01 TaxID=2894084 RepID=UPI001E4514DD|nr:alpha-galactosidase [Arthrobacter sp. AK01]MCD4852039.1 alpha-galactosidase [Arthrobacter sp. AK01]
MSATTVTGTLPEAIHFRAKGCSLLIDLTEPGIPVILHWGADLGVLGEDGVAAARIAGSAHIPYSCSPNVREPSLLPDARNGWLGRPGLLASRQGRQWAHHFSVTSVDINSVPCTTPGAIETGPGRLRVHSTDHESALELDLDVELHSSGLLRTRAKLTNRGDPLEVQQLHLSLPVPRQASELLDFAGRWGMERIVQRQPFAVGQHLRENRRGNTGVDAAHVLHAIEPGTDFEQGEAWGVHTGWSGNHVHVAEQANTGERLLGGGELLMPGEILLQDGEEYLTPWIYGSYGVGLDQVAHRFHDYLRARPQHVSTPRPVTLNVWEAVYFDHDEPRLLELVDLAADIGIERFVLDDGWFGGRRHARTGLGDWNVSEQAWPQGLHPLVDAVKGHGMQFGLWVEPEMVNLDSDLARANPEWIASARADPPIEQRHQHLLDLTNPRCYKNIKSQLEALLTEYPIDYLKWDHNRDAVEAGSQIRGGTPIGHDQTLAVYRMIDELKSMFPGLEIESCAGGGGRIDLGILERTDRVWVSDCIDPLERQRLMRWTGQLIPPELMGAHVGSPRSHTTGRTHDLSFRGAAALLGHYGVEWDLSSATMNERKSLAGWIATYKQHRALIASGRALRGPDPAEDTWLSGVTAADGSEGLFVISSMAWSATRPSARARLRGLDPARSYNVTPVVPADLPSGLVETAWWSHQGLAIPGSVLQISGLQIPTTHPEQSIVIHVKATTGPDRPRKGADGKQDEDSTDPESPLNASRGSKR